MGNKPITGSTKLCGIFGDPIEHTMSPIMHNAAFNQIGLDYRYVPFRVKREDLSQAMKGVKALNIVGLNVTIPHKTIVIPFLDELDSLAEKIGAVNTIVNHDGVLKGYNTDATGFLQALLNTGFEPRGKRVVILGAGGAARGIAFILAERGSEVVMLNRNLDKAKEIAYKIAKIFGGRARALALDSENLRIELSKTDILVNATSIGMSPNINDTPLTSTLLKATPVVFDIVYNPIKTRLLREAEMFGDKTISGLDMLVWQGALAFEKWTGQKAPVELMKRKVIEALQGHEN